MKGSSIPFKKNMIQGGATVLAALVLGLFMVLTVKTLKSYDDTVKVRGLCEKEVPADRVVYRINYTEKDNSLADLRTVVQRNNEIIVNKLRDAGFKEDEIKVGNASYDDRYTYANDVSHITYRYQASQTVTVFTDLGAELGTITVGGILNAGGHGYILTGGAPVRAPERPFSCTKTICHGEEGQS